MIEPQATQIRALRAELQRVAAVMARLDNDPAALQAAPAAVPTTPPVTEGCEITDFRAWLRARHGADPVQTVTISGSPGVPREELESWLAGQPPARWG